MSVYCRHRTRSFHARTATRVELKFTKPAAGGARMPQAASREAAMPAGTPPCERPRPRRRRRPRGRRTRRPAPRPTRAASRTGRAAGPGAAGAGPSHTAARTHGASVALSRPAGGMTGGFKAWADRACNAPVRPMHGGHGSPHGSPRTYAQISSVTPPTTWLWSENEYKSGLHCKAPAAARWRRR